MEIIIHIPYSVSEKCSDYNITEFRLEISVTTTVFAVWKGV